jgi:hypothetical protein
LTTSTSHDARVPKLLVAGADAPVDDRALGGREFADQAPDRLRRERAGRGDRFGREWTAQPADLVDAVGERGEASGPDEVLGEEHVHPRHQHRRVGAGTDRHPFVGAFRGARPPGVDDDASAAALPQRGDPSEEVGARHQAALRRVRIRAHDDEVVGAVDVGRRDRPHAAVEQRADDVLRPLVDRAGRVEPLDAGERPEGADVSRQREVVHRRIAHVVGQRVLAAALDDAVQELLAFGERLVPRCLDQLAVPADQRRPQAVGVVV